MCNDKSLTIMYVILVHLLSEMTGLQTQNDYYDYNARLLAWGFLIDPLSHIYVLIQKAHDTHWYRYFGANYYLTFVNTRLKCRFFFFFEKNVLRLFCNNFKSYKCCLTSCNLFQPYDMHAQLHTYLHTIQM